MGILITGGIILIVGAILGFIAFVFDRREEKRKITVNTEGRQPSNRESIQSGSFSVHHRNNILTYAVVIALLVGTGLAIYVFAVRPSLTAKALEHCLAASGGFGSQSLRREECFKKFPINRSSSDSQ